MKKIEAPILEISNLCKKEKNKTIDKLNIIIPNGESIAVLYKKEDNIELLCDILKGQKKSDKGKIFFKNSDVTGIKNSFGVVERKIDIPKTKSVSEFACYPVVQRGLSRKMASVLVKKEIAAFHLEEFCSKAVSLLPKNLLLRSEIFRAYMCSHELIAIDEPFGDLDQEERENEIKLLENVKNNSGLSLLIFTQSIDIAVRLANSIMVVDSSTQSAGIISVDRKRISKTISKIEELFDAV